MTSKGERREAKRLAKRRKLPQHGKRSLQLAQAQIIKRGAKGGG